MRAFVVLLGKQRGDSLLKLLVWNSILGKEDCMATITKGLKKIFESKRLDPKRFCKKDLL